MCVALASEVITAKQKQISRITEQKLFHGTQMVAVITTLNFDEANSRPAKTSSFMETEGTLPRSYRPANVPI